MTPGLGSRREASVAPGRLVGGSPADLSDRVSDRVSGAGLTVLALGSVVITVGGVIAVVAEHDALAAVCLALLGVCALLALRFAASWRGICRRSAADSAELLGIVDEIGAVVCVRDAEGRYLLVNRQFEQVFAVTRNEVLGRRHQDVFPGSGTVVANDRKALVQGTPVQTQEAVEHIDGPHSYFTVRHPVPGRAGRAYAVCSISTDITELLRAEEQVRRLVTDLEQRVRARTADLEATNREIDAFTYSVSHDLRGPLRAIAGFSEILLEDHAERLEPTGLDYLRRVRAAAGHMAEKIDALLDMSHVARAELQHRPVDLGDLARDALADLRAAEPDRVVQAEIERLAVVGDPRLLGLVMQNLVSNAWKFTAERPRARIGVGRRESRGVAAYYVEDDGTGFDMRYADKLFAPFQRLHEMTRFPGNGIGLAIVERVVARHGGHVWAQSAEGQGATFYFTLATPTDDEPGGGSEA